MVYILLLISFLIHVATFIIIRQFKLKLDTYGDMEQDIKEQAKAIEDTLAVYLIDIRQENNELLQRLENARHIQTETEQPVNNVAEDPQPATEAPVEQEPVADLPLSPPDFQPITVDDKVEDKVEQSLAAKALHLQAKGYTVEEIAKQLNKGTTEIELLLKFQQKNQ
ncbi:hypothetical protein [Gracilibacillus alcaliphilus]|uniref:hypothetical protein n=1 Tax=Gracilibacillus alcaliphilus TaxID=1401441 RepID=UPI0019561AD9|nr:hypothetical protein [Gracilibacillus alcaliphilus]MBM7677960.1 hypothetical protein [Gracilibacillus alcaliphilus]